MRIAIDKLRMAREHDRSLAVREVNDAHVDALRQSMIKNNVNSNSSLSVVVVVPVPNWTDPRKMSEKDVLALVDKYSAYVTGGNHRLAAMRLQHTRLPQATQYKNNSSVW